MHLDDKNQGKAKASMTALSVMNANNELLESWQVQDFAATFPYPTVADDAGNAVTVRDGEAIQAEGNINVDFGFARIFGFESKEISAKAIAVIQSLTNVNSPLMGPLAVSDRTIFGYDGEPGITFGTELDLKVNTWQEGFLGPGNFGVLDTSDLAAGQQGNTGANGVRNMLAGKLEGSVDLNQDPVLVSTQTGNIVGPVIQGMTQRLNQESSPYKSPQNDDTAWQSWLDSYDSDTGMFDATMRIMIVPVVLDTDKVVNGKKDIQIVGFAGFFIESVESDGTITGRFIQGIQIGDEIKWVFPSGDTPGSINMLQTVRLIS